MSRRHLFRFALVIGIAVQSFACAATTTSSSTSVKRTAQLIVRNSHLYDVNLFVVSGSTRVRIGTARSMATSRLTIPAVYVARPVGVVLLADPIGTDNPFTFPPIHVSADDILRLDLANVLPMSSAWTQARL